MFPNISTHCYCVSCVVPTIFFVLISVHFYIFIFLSVVIFMCFYPLSFLAYFFFHIVSTARFWSLWLLVVSALRGFLWDFHSWVSRCDDRYHAHPCEILSSALLSLPASLHYPGISPCGAVQSPLLQEHVPQHFHGLSPFF